MTAMRRVKIVATLGPASLGPETIGRLISAGVDTFRINMSHTLHETAKAAVEAIRAAEGRGDKPIGILVDLQGPKLRIGDSPRRDELEPGAHVPPSTDRRRREPRTAHTCLTPKFSPASRRATGCCSMTASCAST